MKMNQMDMSKNFPEYERETICNLEKNDTFLSDSKNTGEESNTGTTAKVAGKVSCRTALSERTSFTEPNNLTLQICLDNDSES